MEIHSLELDGVKLFAPSIYEDTRGSFTEKLNTNHVNDFKIKQINQSISNKNVFRGFHFQKDPKEQAKYVAACRATHTDISLNF